MSLRRRLILALGSVPLCWGALASAQAQEVGLRPSAAATPETRSHHEPPLLSRTGARRTAVVSAIEKVRGAVVNIHNERNVAQTAEIYAAQPNRVNGMGTGIIIDPRGYIVTNQH